MCRFFRDVSCSKGFDNEAIQLWKIQHVQQIGFHPCIGSDDRNEPIDGIEIKAHPWLGCFKEEDFLFHDQT